MSGRGPEAVTSTPAPMGVVPSGRKTLPESTPAIVLTRRRGGRVTVCPSALRLLLAPTVVGKKGWLADAFTGPTLTPLKANVPSGPVWTRCDTSMIRSQVVRPSLKKWREESATEAPKDGV